METGTIGFSVVALSVSEGSDIRCFAALNMT